MQRGLVTFIVITLVGSWVFSLMAFIMQDSLGPMANLLMIPSLVVPLLAAYIANNVSGGIGHLFAGLKFGNAGWLFLAWFGGLVLACFATVVVIAIGLHGLDLSLDSAIDRSIAIVEAQGQELPDGAEVGLKFSVYGQIIAGPSFGAWIMAAIFCLITFPWLGWFARRMLVYGVPVTISVMMVVGFLHSCGSGLVENPQLGELDMIGRIITQGLQSAVYVPLVLWLLLKTRSAVVPALAQASVYTGLTAVYMLVSGTNPLLGLPTGVVPLAVVLLAGIGLWLWQDPGGKDLVVAGVAFDGALLTPEMVKKERERKSNETAESAPVTDEPPVSPEP